MPRFRPSLLLLASIAIFAALPGVASAYTTAVSLTAGTPSQVARFVPSNPRTPLLYPVEFPEGATDTHLIGLGYRMKSEDLYAIAGGGTLYVLRGELPRTSFKAIQVNSTPGLSPIQGTSWGVAFNPVRDAIGVVDDAGQNLLLDYLNGSLLSSDGTLAYAPGDANAGTAPAPAAVAFTNPAVAAQKTTMYVIDAATDSLAIQGPLESPEAGAGGVLHTVGKLGFDVTPAAGFAFSTDPRYVRENYALLNPAGGGRARICHLAQSDVLGYKGGVEHTAGTALCDPATEIEVGPELRGLAIVPPSTVQFSQLSPSEQEGSEYGDVGLVREGGLQRRLTISYAAIPGQSDRGFKKVSGSVTFEPGESRVAFDIPVRDDEVFQPDREVALRLFAKVPDAVLGNLRTTNVTITDDELNPRLEPRFTRPRVSLDQVLRDQRLIVHYRCRVACEGYMQLVLGSNSLSTFRAHSKAGRRAIVFALGAGALEEIRSHVRHGGVALHVDSEFEIDFFNVEKALHFRLRR